MPIELDSREQLAVSGGLTILDPWCEWMPWIPGCESSEPHEPFFEQPNYWTEPL